MQDYRRLAVRADPVRTQANYAIGEIARRKVLVRNVRVHLRKAEIGTVAGDFPLALVAIDAIVRDAAAYNRIAYVVVVADRDSNVVDSRLLFLALPPGVRHLHENTAARVGSARVVVVDGRGQLNGGANRERGTRRSDCCKDLLHGFSSHLEVFEVKGEKELRIGLRLLE